MEYSSFDDALELLKKYGHRALLAKADIKSAFRLFPIDPSGFNSMGFQFNGNYYFDKCLQMGFTLSCHYFEAFSSFLHRVLEREVICAGSLRYLDDFLFISRADSPACLNALKKINQEMLPFCGIPLNEKKTVFPCTRIEFLGIMIDMKKCKSACLKKKSVEPKGLIQKLSAKKKKHTQGTPIAIRIFSFYSKSYSYGLRVF